MQRPHSKDRHGPPTQELHPRARPAASGGALRSEGTERAANAKIEARARINECPGVEWLGQGDRIQSDLAFKGVSWVSRTQ